MVKRVLKVLGVLLLLVVVGGGGFVAYASHAFDTSMAKVYDVAPLPLERSTDPVVIARGKHLVDSICACSSRLCHGSDLSGGETLAMGPLGTLYGHNITPAGVAAKYTDGELARVILHGIKKDGTSLHFMPVEDFNWLPDDDLLAVISYVRTVPAVTKEIPTSQIGVFGKVLDRLNKFPMDVARRIDHEHRGSAPPAPAPTAAYGAYVGKLCIGCHGQRLSGGPIPGAPPGMAVPRNITPHETGIKDYTYEDFTKLMDTGIMRNGKPLDKLMPIEALAKMNDLERQALWAYLRAVEPRPFGGR